MDYQQSKIYRLYSPSRADVGVYYGSTIQKLCKRFYGHKGDMKRNRCYSSKPIIEIGDAVIELVEDFPCNNKKELEAREYWFIQNNECINTIKGMYDYAECNKRKFIKYREKHREEIKEKRKEWREKNREKINEYYKKNKEEILRKQKERREKAKQTSETVVQVLLEE
jgi:hypothetical protein